MSDADKDIHTMDLLKSFYSNHAKPSKRAAHKSSSLNGQWDGNSEKLSSLQTVSWNHTAVGNDEFSTAWSYSGFPIWPEFLNL